MPIRQMMERQIVATVCVQLLCPGTGEVLILMRAELAHASPLAVECSPRYTHGP
jgi:hypothetical protein